MPKLKYSEVGKVSLKYKLWEWWWITKFHVKEFVRRLARCF